MMFRKVENPRTCWITEHAEITWQLENENGPVALAGLYRHTVMSAVPLIWFRLISPPTLSDIRAMHRALKRIAQIWPMLDAIIARDNIRARRFAEHLGFVFLRPWADKEDIFRWQR